MEFEHLEAPELAELLRKFYGEVRTHDGKKYARQAFVNIQSRLNRHLTTPHSTELFTYQDMQEMKLFFHANKVLRGQQRIQKDQNDEKLASTKWVAKADLDKMYTFICKNLDDSETLAQKVYLDIAFYTGRRGREGLIKLRIDSFAIKTKPDGRKYIVMTHTERKKKSQGDKAVSKAIHHEPKPLIMEQPGSIRCAVTSFKMYLSHLDKSVLYLFQAIKRKINPKFVKVWFYPRPLGKNTIADMLKIISERAECSEIHTNHCLRYTTANAMKKGGACIQEIAYVTDHHNYQSLES